MWESQRRQNSNRLAHGEETSRCGHKFMNEWMNEKWTPVRGKCKIEFVLTLTQARGLWGCLGNWLPVRWMGKWVWSQQGFVGRWERRQAIGTQHMPHGGLMLMLWQRCWPSSISWEMRRVTTTRRAGSTHGAVFVLRRTWRLTAARENTTIMEHLVEEEIFNSATVGGIVMRRGVIFHMFWNISISVGCRYLYNQVFLL